MKVVLYPYSEKLELLCLIDKFRFLQFVDASMFATLALLARGFANM